MMNQAMNVLQFTIWYQITEKGKVMENRYLYKVKTTPKEKGEFNNVWVIGNLIVSNGKYYIHPVGNIVNVKNEIGRIIAMHEVIPSTICQCTGLKDKNGKLIWENDVIRFWDTYSTENGQAEMDCIGKVVWDDETISFQVTNRLSSESYEVLDECSVIGNIFDNPKLLESEG